MIRCTKQNKQLYDKISLSQIFYLECSVREVVHQKKQVRILCISLEIGKKTCRMVTAIFSKHTSNALNKNAKLSASINTNTF